MSNTKMRTVLLCSFLFAASLVIAKAGLTWTRGDDAPDEEEFVEREKTDIVVHIDEMKHLEKLKENEARIREHAERLAERIAARVEIAVASEDLDFDYDFEHNGDGELMIRKEFDVSAGGDLHIKVPGADVEIVSASSDRAEILVFLDARDMDKARTYFEALDFKVEASGNTVSVKANSADKNRWGWNRHGHAHITVRAAIPSRFNADVSTTGGDISVEHLNGELKLETSGGDIDLGAIEGGEINVTTSGGDIDAGSLNGRVKLTTSGGDIDLGSLKGPEISVHTSGGDIDAGMLEAPNVDVRTSGGDISLGTVQGDAVVNTSGGDIEVGQLVGGLEATTSGGDIEVHITKAAELSLSTTGGSIDIHGPSNLGANLQLRGSEVAMAGSVRFEGTKKKNVVDGLVNGGGPRISATSSGGGISLELGQ